MNKKVGGMNKKLSNLRLSLLSAAISAITASMAFAGPEGGQVTGGSGSISSTGNTTTIHQQTDRMAIDWQSYNIDVDERVQYIQPDSSSVSLNRILSNSASSIQGRIDANGQVILVNPHGIMFGENSIVNAGGILASGLSIDTDQFMNGDFTFKEIEGTDGAVVASGVINAASGGSVALIGKSVKNEGLISAELGSVHFAAGREAVITFGESGFIGVRVSDALVEEQMGVDAAVLNSGEINATGGQVLLTASTSRDIFSGVINTGDLEFDRSVVVNNDGSYSLGGGADIANTGSINVSGERGGEVVLIGENVDHSGIIKAESFIAKQGGSVELHSTDTTLLSSDSLINTNALQGIGGDVKILGGHVGLVENSHVISNGQAGGQILIGGDERGENIFVPNASAVFAGENTLVEASALSSASGSVIEYTVSDISNDITHDGGKIILWGDDYLSAHGEVNAQGLGEGDGGFIETSSALVNLNPTVDVNGGENGESGLWLIDPYDITIGDDADAPQVSDSVGGVFTPTENGSFLTVQRLRDALTGGSSVLVETAGAAGTDELGNITVADEISFGTVGRGASLTLLADNNININESIFDNTPTGDDSLNLTLTADGDILIAADVVIETEGGDFTASGNNFDNQGTINVQSGSGGGNIDITGDVIDLGAIEFGDASGANNAITSTFEIKANDINVTENIIDGGNGTSDDHISNVVFNADGNITFDGSRFDNRNGKNISNLTLNADVDGNDIGNVLIKNGASIWLNGGDFVASGHDVTIDDNGSGEVTLIGTEGGSFLVGAFLDPITGSLTRNPITGFFNSNNDNSEFHTFRNGDRTGNVSIYADENIDIGRTFSANNSEWDYDRGDAVSILFDAGGDLTLHESLAIDQFTGSSTENTLEMNAGGELVINAEIVHASDSSEFTFGSGTGVFSNTAMIDSNGSIITFNVGSGGFENNAAINSNNANIGINSSGEDGNTTGVMFNADITAQDLFVTTAGGDITDGATNGVNAAIVVINITLTAVTDEISPEYGDITLDNPGLRIGNQISAISAKNLNVIHNGEIRILNTALIGDLTLQAVGNGIFDDGVVTVNGRTTFIAEDNSIEFNNVQSNFGGAVSATGSRLQIQDANDFVIGELNLTGNATNTINAIGNITHAAGDSISTNDTTGRSINITSEQGSLQVNGIVTQGGSIDINAVVDVTHTAGTSINTNGGTLDVTGGSVQVSDINTQGGSITIEATSVAPFIALSGDINSGNGFITLNAQNGDIELLSDVEIDAGTSDFMLTSNIVADDDVATESLTINAQQITLENVSTAATEDGASGGAITLNGSGITVDSINTSGRDGTDILVNNGGSGGAVLLTATNPGDSAVIDINGDINTQGVLPGTNGLTEIILTNGAASGLVDLSDAGIFTSSVNITGSNSAKDELTGPNVGGNWLSDETGQSFFNVNESAGVSTFTNFETVTGGSGEDIFTISTNSSVLVNVWNGGEGNDQFNIDAGVDTNVYGNVSGSDDNSINTVSLTTNTGAHDWTIKENGTGTLTGGFSFFLFDNLNGSDGGADRFRLDSPFGEGNEIDARGSLADSVLVSDSSDPQLISFDEDFSGLVSVEAIEADGDANDFVLQLTDGSTSNDWIISGINRGTIFNNDEPGDPEDPEDLGEQISFINFATIIGNSGDDKFVLVDEGSIAGIDGGGGLNHTADFSGGIANLDLIIDESLGDITEAPIRVANIQTVLAPQGTENTLSFNSDADNTYIWTFFDFDGDVEALSDGARDGRIERTGTEATAINFANFDVLNGGDAQDTFVIAIAGVEATIEGGNGNDTLQSYENAVLNTWTIDDPDEGSLSYSANNNSALLVTAEVKFSEIESLIGADAAPDTFSFVDDGDISGSISAGESDGIIDTVDYSLSGVVQRIIIGDGSNGVEDVENIIGNSSFVNTLTGNGTYFLWDVTDDDSGKVFNELRTESIAFENFSNLVATSDNDTFTLTSTGSIGDIQGVGTNELISVGVTRDWFITAAGNRIEQAGANVLDTFTGIQTLQGADNFSDSFTLATDSDFTGGIFGGASTASDQDNTFTVLSAADTDVRWNLLDTGFNVSRPGSTEAVSFSDITIIVGGAGNDTFSIDDAFSGAGLTLDGAGPNDRDDFNISALTENETTLLLDVVAENNALSLSLNMVDIVTVENIEAVTGDRQNNLTFQSLFANDWDIQSSSSGQLTATVNNSDRTIDFTNIINLTGGDLADDFDIADGANITGLLIGAGGSNSLTNNNTAQTWRLTDAFAGEVGGATFTGIQTLNANDSILIGRAQNNVWNINLENSGTVALDDPASTDRIIFTGMSSLYGNTGSDNFIVAAAGSITEEIQGAFLGAANTLEVERAAGSTGQTDWIIDDENSGSVTNIVNDFSNIQNLTGGFGTDIFNFEGGSLSGLIDARDNETSDIIDDELNVGDPDQLIVFVGTSLINPEVEGAQGFPSLNVTGVESIFADARGPNTINNNLENDRWIVMNTDRDVEWQFNAFNSGTVFELDRENTQFTFDNFGSAQGGSGVDNSVDDNNLTGIFNPFGGGQNLEYTGEVNLAVVFITPNILGVEGTDGNVVLRIAPDNLIEEANFNGSNEWTIDGTNSGNFLASYFDNGEDNTGFSFDFSGVNRIEGGAGDDLFTFSSAGELVDGYINGGGGNNRITLSNNHLLGLDFGASTLNTVATDLTGDDTIIFPGISSLALPELFELDNRNGVIDVLNITSITAEASSLRTEALRIRSAETGNFSWNFGSQLTDTDNGTVLSYTGFDEVQGGSGNDLFALTTDLTLGYQLDGGDGQDTVDLSAFTNVSVDLDPLEGDFIGIETYEGNNTNSELLAADGLNIWTIDGVNQGSVLNSGETIRFTGFNTLQGGSGRDDITITQGGIRGDIFGNDGDDELNVQLGFTDETLNSGATEAVNFVGGAGNNTVDVSGGSATNRFAGDYTPTVLVGTSGETEQQTFNFNFEQASSAQNTEIVLTDVNSIVEQVFTSAFTINNVRGQSDIIRISDGFIQVGDFSEVSASNNASLIVDGEISDQLLIVGDINVADEFVVNNASVALEDNPLEGGSFTINANSAVRFNNNDQVGEADNRINLATPNLSLNGISGDTYLLSNSNLNIDQLNAPGGVVDIISRGNITDSATLNSLQNIVLASDDDIILDNENLLTGLITLSAQNVTLNNGTTNLGDTNAQNFTLTTRANVIDQGALTISGTTTINAQENSAITLDNMNNVFNQVTVNNTGSVILVDGSDDGVSVSGSAAAGYSVTADGIIISNGLEAGMIELISSNNDILVQDTINAETALTLSGNNITINGITNVGGETATNSVTTLAADNAVQLNAAVLGNADNNEMNITAGSVLQSAGANLSAQNLTIETSGAQTLLGNTIIGNNFNSISGSSFTMNSGAVIAEIIANNITISAQDNVVTQSLTGETVELVSASGDIEQQANITTDTININALSGNFNSSNGAILTLNQGVSTLNAIDATLGGSIVGDGSLIINLANQFSQSGNIALGNVEVNANNIAMDSNSDISGTSGVILNAVQNIELASVNSMADVSLIAGGAVVDNNGVATNVTGNSLFARSEMGFGEPGISGNTIETSVGNIDVQNDLNGIGLVNNGDVSVTSLISNSDILFQNDNGNVILANSDSGSYDLDATDAREAGGVINANYDFGRLTLVVSDGFLDATPAAFVERPELVGDIVEVSTTEGFGVTRRIVVFARTEAIVSGRGIEPFFGFNTPPELGLTTDTDLLSLTDVSSAAELLVEVEDLQDINPAVFTDIRNFAFGNISIRMPRDQLYDYGVYEEEDDGLDERF